MFPTLVQRDSFPVGGTLDNFYKVHYLMTIYLAPPGSSQ